MLPRLPPIVAWKASRRVLAANIAPPPHATSVPGTRLTACRANRATSRLPRAARRVRHRVRWLCVLGVPLSGHAAVRIVRMLLNELRLLWALLKLLDSVLVHAGHGLRRHAEVGS